MVGGMVIWMVKGESMPTRRMQRVSVRYCLPLPAVEAAENGCQARARVMVRTGEIGGGWLVTMPSEPPVLKSSILLMALVLAVTANCMVASSAVFVSPTRMENVAESEVF